MARPDPLNTLRRLASTHPQPIWLVGGCVRDRLLGREVLDYDCVLRGSLEFARRFAAATQGAFVLLDDERDTARVVFKRYGRSPREPLTVDFAELRGASLTDDLAQRDFTLNAIACPLAAWENPTEADWCDPFSGREDLRQGCIRAVSVRALEDDPLRALRAFRFAAQLDFTVVPETKILIRQAAPRLREVAAERITGELFKLLATPRCAAVVQEMQELGLWAELFAPAETDGEAAARALPALEGVLAHLPAVFPPCAERLAAYLRAEDHLALLKLAVLLCSSAPARATRRLALSRAQRRCLHTYAAGAIPRALLKAGGRAEDVPARQGDRQADLNTSTLQRLKTAIWARHFRRRGEDGVGAVLVQWAWLHARGDEAFRERVSLAVQEALNLYYHRFEPVLRRPRLVTGYDLQEELGLSPGPRFKGLLASVLQAELVGQVRTREEALAWLRRRLRRDRR